VYNLCDSAQIFNKPLVVSTVTIDYTAHFWMLFHSYPYEKYKISCFDFYENPACPAAFRVKYIYKILPKFYNKCEVKLDNFLHCNVKFHES
jgi:hypothetical protein